MRAPLHRFRVSRRLRLSLALSLTAHAATAAPLDRPSAREAAAHMGRTLVTLGRDEARSQAQSERARVQLVQLNAREAALEARIGANRTALVRLLGALERWRRDPPPALVVAPRQAVDAARAAILMRAVTPELQRRARALADQARELARVRRAAAEADAALFSAESEAAERRVAIDTLAARKAAVESALASPEEQALQAKARAAAAQSGSLGPLAAELQSLAPSRPSPPPERLTSPVPGAPTRGWGAPWPDRGRSEGLAWSPPGDAVVLSPAAGVVEFAGPLRRWGLVVVLRLPGGWRVVLAGLQTVTTPPGSEVAAGEPIGRMPKTANAELYMELRRGVEPVDPTRLTGQPAAPALRGRR